ncbi:MAG: fluoride efflux transporter CrcB [Candidatus Competibacteraceae bacterium]|nr:fluoride efflux transporter CrcB [Candidatus Competibacteraceae bacterium]
MPQLLAIAAGGALGALLRFWVSGAVYAWAGRAFPWGTLAVNLLGSLAMGLLFSLSVDRLSLGPVWRGGMLVGFLGAFTTFSTFSLETLNLLEQGRLGAALANVLTSVLLCVGAAWLGLVLGRTL